MRSAGLIVVLASSSAAMAGYDSLGSFGGHDYYINPFLDTYAAHTALAAGSMYHLVTFSSQAEFDFVRDAAFAYTPAYNEYWLGLSDAATEGTFAWDTGESVGYTFWNPGEPNDAGGEDFAVMNTGAAGQWNDISGGLARGGIYELGTDAPHTVPLPGAGVLGLAGLGAVGMIPCRCA